MNKYFEIVGLKRGCPFILPNDRRFDLTTGIPSTALEVYKSGFRYLGLKPGAEELFKKEKVADLIKLISQARRVQDVEILALAKPDSPQVKEATEKRKTILTNK
ncbi:hypothetical protein [Flavobacterium beibuense]|uniref:hypothetical protein n=1 Tax=Flavobacterium beibuense TaxID=657326 RepID=UPI003A917633